ncbi:hypothetical protein HK103_003406, partial [Boothiomyces macroporosus]
LVEPDKGKSHTCSKMSFYMAAREDYKEKILSYIEKVYQLAGRGTLSIKYYVTRYIQENQQIPVVDEQVV